MIIFVSSPSAFQLFILIPNFYQISKTGEVLKVTKFLKALERNFIRVLPAAKAAKWTFMLLAFRESTQLRANNHKLWYMFTVELKTSSISL